MPKLIMAPMAGITDSVCRRIVMEQGADAAFTEMVSSRGLFYKDAKTASLLDFMPAERPLTVQIFGNSPEVMAYAAAAVSELGFDGVDINAGCPAPKIFRNGDGAALMGDIRLAARICAAVAAATPLPVSVKFRKGLDDDSINGVEFARAMEDSGASSLTIHARTARAQYSGSADVDYAAQVVKAVKVPVCVSGDIFSAQDALAVSAATGAAGLMIGRGGLGNPWLFSQIKAAFAGETPEYPTPRQRIEAALRHARALCEYKGARVGLAESRKFTAWYIRGMKDAARLRCLVNGIEQQDALEALLLEYLDEYETDGEAV